MSQTVVVALDSSDLSARAMPFARTAAHLSRGRMVLVHATVHSGRAGACLIEGQLSQLSSTRPMEVLLLRIVSVGPLFVGWDAAVVVPPMDESDLEAEAKTARSYLAQHAAGVAAEGLGV